MVKWLYEFINRYFRAPWDAGAREKLVVLVESGRIKPCRTIDLGCGTGANAIYLARKGVEVTGVDYAEASIEKSRARQATHFPAARLILWTSHLRHPRIHLM